MIFRYIIFFLIHFIPMLFLTSIPEYIASKVMERKIDFLRIFCISFVFALSIIILEMIFMDNPERLIK